MGAVRPNFIAMTPTEDFCPVPSCTNTRHVSKVMCVACWARVPMACQRQVLLRRNQVARAVKGKSARLISEYLRAYKKACDFAIAAVTPREVA
jgi:hypothetical protein